MVVVVRRGDPGVIEEIVPKSAASAESFGGSLGTGLFPEEALLVARATEKRRQEFTTGRECARGALAALGVAAAPILRGYRGAPQWPDGVVGSITHCAGYCAAAVARGQDLVAIGLDAEPNAPLPGGVLELVSLPAERARLRELAVASPAMGWDRLLFCAKEAVYKAWFPLTGKWLGFADADITIDAGERAFTAVLQVPAPVVNGAPLTSFTGSWLAKEDLLLAAIAVPALLPALCFPRSPPRARDPCLNPRRSSAPAPPPRLASARPRPVFSPSSVSRSSLAPSLLSPKTRARASARRGAPALLSPKTPAARFGSRPVLRLREVLRRVLGQVVDVQRPEFLSQVALVQGQRVGQQRRDLREVLARFAHVTLQGLGRGDGAQELPEESEVRVVQRAAHREVVQLARR
jgi:4'-phosphopantetheinyl transferase EntD